LFLFAVSRLMIVALIIFSRQIVERGPHEIVSGQDQHGGTFLDIMTQWDGTWYRYIAERGYASPMPAVSTAFFPMYPLAVRAVAFAVRDLQVASLLVSNGCLIAAALLLNRLLRLDYDERVCRRAIVFLMFNPVSFFFSAAYTESMFLLLSIGALLAARQGRWLGSGLCGALLAATRPPGMLIAVPLLAEHLIQGREKRESWRRIFQPRLLWLGLVPVGLVLYLFHCYLSRGDWLAPLHAQDAWTKTLTWPWQSYFWPRNFAHAYIPLNQAIVAVAVVLTAVGFLLKIRWSYLVYVVAAMLFYLAWGTLDSLPRYLSVLFPLYLALALVSTRWRWLYEPLLAFSVAFLAYCTVLFANAYQMT